MKIYLVRHGLAEERSLERPDADRALTKKGKRKTRKAMRGLVRLGAEPDLILSSPLVRAWQTAELLASALRAKDGPRVETALSPGGDAKIVFERLKAAGRDSVALVGHEPDLSQLAKLLTGGEVVFAKAGVARVDGEPAPGGGKLVWLLEPLLLRQRAR